MGLNRAPNVNNALRGGIFQEMCGIRLKKEEGNTGLDRFEAAVKKVFA
jgi:hypothetical protein